MRDGASWRAPMYHLGRELAYNMVTAVAGRGWMRMIARRGSKSANSQRAHGGEAGRAMRTYLLQLWCEVWHYLR